MTASTKKSDSIGDIVDNVTGPKPSHKLDIKPDVSQIGADPCLGSAFFAIQPGLSETLPMAMPIYHLQVITGNDAPNVVPDEPADLRGKRY